MLIDNHGYASIGALSRSIGCDGFGTIHRASANGHLPVDGEAVTPPLPVDLAVSVQALGVPVTRARSLDELRDALDGMRGAAGPTCVYVETDRHQGVPNFDGWWDVPVAEVASQPSVQEARAAYEQARTRQRTVSHERPPHRRRPTARRSSRSRPSGRAGATSASRRCGSGASVTVETGERELCVVVISGEAHHRRVGAGRRARPRSRARPTPRTSRPARP